jgi:hypothetical protein
MLGRRHPNDIDLYQMLGTLLLHVETGGVFAEVGREFKREYAQILKRYGLDDAIDDEWVYHGQDRRDDERSRYHYRQVTRFTDAYFACIKTSRAAIEAGQPEEEAEKGIVFDVRRLIDSCTEKVKSIQQTAFADAAITPSHSFSPLAHV